MNTSCQNTRKPSTYLRTRRIAGLHFSDEGRCRWCERPINPLEAGRYCDFECLAADWLDAAVTHHPRLPGVGMQIQYMRHARRPTPSAELGRMTRLLIGAGWSLQQIQLALKFTFGASVATSTLRGKLQ